MAINEMAGTQENEDYYEEKKEDFEIDFWFTVGKSGLKKAWNDLKGVA